jgi:hypothetical protein
LRSATLCPALCGGAFFIQRGIGFCALLQCIQTAISWQYIFRQRRSFGKNLKSFHYIAPSPDLAACQYSGDAPAKICIQHHSQQDIGNPSLNPWLLMYHLMAVIDANRAGDNPNTHPQTNQLPDAQTS